MKSNPKPCEMKQDGCLEEVRKRFTTAPNVCFNPKCMTAYAQSEDGQKRIIKAFKNDEKEKKAVIKKHRPEVKKGVYKEALQVEVNKLARMIDAKFGFVNCIDCDKPLTFTNGAHFHPVKSNEAIRFNLHNIHSARMNCNYYDPNHKTGYTNGLQSRYGLKYFNLVNEIPLKYKELHLTGLDIVEALKRVRDLIRNFDTFKFENAIQAREQCNRMIGIYG